MAYDKKTGRTIVGDQIKKEFIESRMPDSPKCACGRWASFGGKCSACCDAPKPATYTRAKDDCGRPIYTPEEVKAVDKAIERILETIKKNQPDFKTTGCLCGLATGDVCKIVYGE